MKIIIPMAGTGERFVRAGYHDPKPLIRVANKPIIEYICSMFDVKNDDFFFICNRSHMEMTDMESILRKIVPNSKIITINNHKLGPIHTVLAAGIEIDDDEEIIISYCDNPYLWNYENFKDFVRNNKSDGCILTHRGFHPHRLSPTLMAFLKEENGIVSEIKEKAAYTNNPMNEHASTGTYYFNKGSYIKKYFKAAIDQNINYNGEFYITLAYNLLIKDGLKVNCYCTDFVSVFGTPEEVENFEAWQTLLNSSQIKNEDDLIKCYQYWKSYNEKRNS
jgi:NDP-sugar pyrophosphorylase family protein